MTAPTLLTPANAKAIVESKIKAALEVTVGAMEDALRKKVSKAAPERNLPIPDPLEYWSLTNIIVEPGVFYIQDHQTSKVQGISPEKQIKYIGLLNKKKAKGGIAYTYRISPLLLVQNTKETVKAITYGEERDQNVWEEIIPVATATLKPDQSVDLEFGWLTRKMTTNLLSFKAVGPSTFEPTHELDFLLKPEVRLARAQARLDAATQPAKQADHTR